MKTRDIQVIDTYQLHINKYIHTTLLHTYTTQVHNTIFDAIYISITGNDSRKYILPVTRVNLSLFYVTNIIFSVFIVARTAVMHYTDLTKTRKFYAQFLTVSSDYRAIKFIYAIKFTCNREVERLRYWHRTSLCDI